MRILINSACALVLATTFLTPAFAAETVTIATDATFPPFESIDENGKLIGFDIELMEAICKEAELDCDIIGAAWDGMFPSLIEGKYDALISQLTVTDKRRQVVAFSDIYDHPIFRFAAKKGADITISPEGVTGKIIAVQTGTPMDAYVTAHMPGATIKRYDSGSAPFLDLTNGRADLVLGYQAQIVHSFLKTDDGKDFELTGPEMTGKDAKEFGEGVAIAIGKNNTRLVEDVNRGLSKVRENGTLKALMTKYFGE
ncbi:transporter substrate-binding domain-containing protein [Agrobacterium tumefaciens]|uniref:Arginine/lysine/histidine/glutamine transport system substrate-binding and permease protein n=1 Tax=Agrobacterium tumefaciens TaxID=358 RepID=A0A2L2LL11_AGRTU|nr:transporter substrate-binding domain-containing protein [Agrobacterium tumefaciens]AVH44986.1 arginine/lysine/histidine/glutamine transport system substrate-binding and permease protein [Agrobacterium tumefaciens]NSY98879.1 transporter substrate-binding domain-containing protein [Agrobacterium tumefaciens]